MHNLLTYSDSPQIFITDDTNQSVDLFLSLWEEQCQSKEAKGYVLFLDKENRLIAWENLKESTDMDCCAREIAAWALMCNARSVILSCHRDTMEANGSDAELVIRLFKICEALSIEILDYLIITPNGHLCHTDWFSAD